MEEMPFTYVLTYRYSQDHIELLFSCIRAKGGWNNNPNSLQLKYALRRMLLENAVTASAHANCQILDNNATIPIFHKRKHVAPLIEESPPDATNESQSNQAQLSRLVSQLELNKQSNYVLNILYYISGLIVAKLMKQVKCSSCIGDLTGTCTTTTPSEHDYCKQANPGHVSRDSHHFPNSSTTAV